MIHHILIALLIILGLIALALTAVGDLFFTSSDNPFR